MKTAGQQLTDTLKFSFLIVWSDAKQKWRGECAVLKLKFEAATYKEVLEEMVRATLNHNCPDVLFEVIEDNRQDYSKGFEHLD